MTYQLTITYDGKFYPGGDSLVESHVPRKRDGAGFNFVTGCRELVFGNLTAEEIDIIDALLSVKRKGFGGYLEYFFEEE